MVETQCVNNKHFFFSITVDNHEVEPKAISAHFNRYSFNGLFHCLVSCYQLHQLAVLAIRKFIIFIKVNISKKTSNTHFKQLMQQ